MQADLIKEIGARIAKSLFCWGLAAVLAFSAYKDIVRIAGSAAGSGAQAGKAADGISGRPRPGAQERLSQEAQERLSQEVQEPGTGRGRVALTFDDGPHPIYTKLLLDGLLERNIKASFFVIGSNIPGNEDLIRRMAGEGHLIGNHTYDHVQLSAMSAADACAQVEKTARLVREITGRDTEFVRPPFGAWDKDMERLFTMIPVLWSVDPKDWTMNDRAAVVQRVLDETEDGDIILLHDWYESSVQAGLEIADRLLEQGYEFVTVEELILE